MFKRTTLQDIANATNLTPSGVSKALSNHSGMSEETKEMVRKKAKELNYQQNKIALSLKTGKSKIIGIIVPKLNIFFFLNVIAGIEEVANKHHFNVIICQSDDSFEKEVECINTLINQNVACIMISLAASTKTNSHLTEIHNRQIELIQFDRIDNEIQTNKVVNNNEYVILEAVEHLLSQGYKTIAHLAGPQNISIYKTRKQAFEKALSYHHLINSPNYIIYNCHVKELALVSIKQLLLQTNKPDAIIAASDFMALTVLEIAKELNIRIPEDLGVIGYSNELFTELTTPTITSINQFSLKMGQAVATMFFQELKKDSSLSAPKSIIINPKLIIRASSQRLF